MEIIYLAGGYLSHFTPISRRMIFIHYLLLVVQLPLQQTLEVRQGRGLHVRARRKEVDRGLPADREA